MGVHSVISREGLVGFRALMLLSLLAIIAQFPQGANAARTIAWPPSASDRANLKCFSDTTRPECRTYEQLKIAMTEKQARKEAAEPRKPKIIAPAVPSVQVPVLVAPMSSPVVAAPSSAASEPPAGAIPRSEDWLIERKAATKRAVKPIKLLAVGDSMTMGREGDWTWRYRLWQWFRQNNIPVQFVGPWNGTATAYPPKPPVPPQVPGDPPPPDLASSVGGYAKGVLPAFNNLKLQHQHYSAWGRPAVAVFPEINQLVKTYQPDFVLTDIGYNDVNWLGSAASDVCSFISQIITNARDAKPNVKFVIGNIVTPALTNWDEVVGRINQTNAMLPTTLQSLNTTASPIGLARIADVYSCTSGNCPAAYDPVHPNALGEFQIASAFAKALRGTFNLGKGDLAVPANPPQRYTRIPANVTAAGSPSGITVKWPRVYGARNYDVQYRQVGSTTWSLATVDAERYDTTWTFAGQQYEYQVRTNNLQIVSPWSPIIKATAAPQLAAAPPNITITPSATGFDISWSPATGPYSNTVNLYQILWLDMDVPGAFIGGVGARGTSASVTGFTPGHRIATWMVSWNANGGGLPTGARPVTIGGHTPAAPTNLVITATDAVTIQMTWCGDPSASGYRIWSRNAANNETLRVSDGINSPRTNTGATYLFPGTWNYEFCVSAINGNAESPIGECVRAGAPSDGPRGTKPASGAVCYDGTVPASSFPSPSSSSSSSSSTPASTETPAST